MGDYIATPLNASTLISPNSCLETRCVRKLPFVAVEALTHTQSCIPFYSLLRSGVNRRHDPTINDDSSSLKPIPPCSCPRSFHLALPSVAGESPQSTALLTHHVGPERSRRRRPRFCRPSRRASSSRIHAQAAAAP